MENKMNVKIFMTLCLINTIGTSQAMMRSAGTKLASVRTAAVGLVPHRAPTGTRALASARTTWQKQSGSTSSHTTAKNIFPFFPLGLVAASLIDTTPDDPANIFAQETVTLKNGNILKITTLKQVKPYGKETLFLHKWMSDPSLEARFNRFVNKILGKDDRPNDPDTLWVRVDLIQDDQTVIVGVCLFMNHERNVYIVSLAVDASYQKTGIGRAIIDHITKATHYKSMSLTSAPSSEGFYHKLGFEQTRARDRYFCSEFYKTFEPKVNPTLKPIKDTFFEVFKWSSL